MILGSRHKGQNSRVKSPTSQPTMKTLLLVVSGVLIDLRSVIVKVLFNLRKWMGYWYIVHTGCTGLYNVSGLLEIVKK